MADDQFSGDLGPKAPLTYSDVVRPPEADVAADVNPFLDRLKKDPTIGAVGLGERFLLNTQASSYGGTIASGVAGVVASEAVDTGNLLENRDTSQAAADWLNARSTAMQRYDAMSGWHGPMEGLVSLAGQVSGSLTSPEGLINKVPGLSRLFAPAVRVAAPVVEKAIGKTAAGVAGRIGESAVSQGFINTVTDPIVQALNLKSGIQKDFDWQQMALAFPLGFATGGAIHALGEAAGAAARAWRGKTAAPGERVTVSDIDPGAGPGPLHGESGTIVTPAEGDRPPVIKLDDGTTTRVDPELLRPADVPETPDVLPPDRPEEPAIAGAKPDEPIAEQVQRAGEKAAASPTDPQDIKTQLTEQDRQIAALKAAQAESAPAPETSDLKFRKTAGSGPSPEPLRPEAANVRAVPADHIASLHEQSMALGEALNMPLRQGRVRGGKEALGQFDERQGVTRTKIIADFETVSHEAGHYIEKLVGDDLTNLIDRNKGELGALDYDKTRLDQGEGFAEYARLYLTNPAAARLAAPGFEPQFRALMERQAPEAMKVLDAAQAAHTAYVQAPSDVKLDAIVKTQEADGLFKRMRKDGMGRTIAAVINKAYQVVLDDKAPVRRAVRDLARQAYQASGTRLTLEGGKNPEIVARLFVRSQQAALGDMRYGVRPYHQVSPEGPALRDAIVTATGSSGAMGRWDDVKVKDFSNYLVARRAEVLWRKFDAGQLPNRPLALTKGDVAAAITKAEAENVTFRAAAAQVHEYTRQLLRKQFEGGLLERESYDKLLKEEFYVPLYRVMDDKPMAAGGPIGAGRSEGPGKTNLIKRIKGSDRDIVDPIQSLMTQTFLVNRTLAHNDLVRSFVSLARTAAKAGAESTGRIIEEIPAHQVIGERFNLAEAVKNAARENGTDPQDTEVLLSSLADVFGDTDPVMAPIYRREATGKRGEPILFYKDGGKLKAVRLISEDEGLGLYESLASLPAQTRDVAIKLGAIMATKTRIGITSNPVFALTNWFRDQVAATILRPDFVPFNLRGVAQEVMQSKTAQMYAYAGGMSPGAAAGGLGDAFKGDIDELAKKGWAVAKVGGLRDLMHGDIVAGAKAIGEFVETSETGTRLNVMDKVFAQKKAQGLADHDAMMEAAWQATDLMDFSRHGSHTMAIRAIIPFLNASANSLDKAARVFVAPILRALTGDMVTSGEVAEFKNAGLAWFKMAGVGGALGYLYSTIMSKNDAYRDANDQLRATHLIIPGAAVGQPGKIIVVPKPFELAIGFNMGELLGQYAATGDPRVAEFARDGAMEVLSPPSLFTNIPVISTVDQLMLGKSFFTGGDIVPGRLQGLEPSEQIIPGRTSSFAKLAGKMFNVSPAKVDFAIGAEFGLWGRDLLSATTMADPSAPDPALEDTMFLRRFVKNADISSETTKQFWSIAGSQNGEFVVAKNTYEGFLTNFRDDDAARYLGGLPAEKRAYVTLMSAADENGKAAFKADEKRLQPLYRAAAAVSTVNNFIREIDAGIQHSISSGDRMDMDPSTKRMLIDNLRVLSAMEQRNALVMLKEPGYGGRQLLSTDDQFGVIMAINPAAGAELATRYASAKIYTQEATARLWPDAQSRLLEDGSQAQIGDLAADAGADGYAFGGDREKKAPKRRVTIPGTKLQ